MAAQESSLPKYRRIADALKRAITAGEFRPGDRLPGENDLMDRHGVARMTARQALGVLTSEGLAEARKGAGVFVRDFQPIRRRGVPRLAREQWGQGQSVWAADVPERDLVVDEVTVDEEQVSGDVAARLDIAPGDAVTVRRRRFVLDGKPVLLSTSYLPAALVAGSAITQPDAGAGGTYARLAELGAAPARFREEMRSRMPASEEADRLRLPAGTPVILISRTAMTADGRTVEVNEMILDSSAYVLEYDFDA
ncbi:GntR family transcriptional regulator [Streptomyces sp. Je 1-4]|uniref:GntR family transcriptional regulator n=1 Tax=Streptomyces TaxID=1883 RepID=UPI0021D95CFA|nr:MULTISPECIES: GntR family transcriptional regulator [unclassified Streptomyces]UYB40559.1 GntR family transcriptional regulator [Streptomyces sp. Je 1-4]UZQ36690.1 GntR family transcriptional regulator [Streptomyces sp. Je 1-4] [Streptomyces sp. Je 1-4 4N24]UZQ44107.1 GntR family transcriptional regulator [Streptomyces sp. Je 1-4] [Streptomyces sp. Je 1-4 4N24_ara]